MKECGSRAVGADMIESVSERRDIVILGSTGSVGTQALDGPRQPGTVPGRGPTAGGSQEELFEQQVADFAPAYSGLGEDASIEAAGTACDVVLNAMTGAVGLRPTLAALDSGNTLALANKESLIIGGPVVTARAKPGQIVPVDSEHSALAQCLRSGRADEVRRLCSRPAVGRSGAAPASSWPRSRSTKRWPTHVGHGSGRDDQLGHPGEQGPRGDRGAPALRHPLRPHRGGRAPDQRRALDGRVHRRLHHRPGQPAHHADPDRARPELARAAGRRRSTGRLDECADLEFFPLDNDAFPAVRLARRAGSRAAPRRPSTTPRTRSASRRSARAAWLSSTSSTRSPRCSTGTTYAGTKISPSTTCWPLMPGRARRPLTS